MKTEKPDATTLSKLAEPLSAIQRYGLAVVSVAVAVGLALLVDRYHVRDVEVPLFLFAIALTAWHAGGGPAALAFALSSAGLNYYFTEPYYTFYVTSSDSRGWRKEADEHLRRVGELARRSLSEARRSMHALRPQALQEHNFWDALKGIVKNTTVGTSLHTIFEADGKLPELPYPWQENLLHIGQEALTNTLKYAHAKNFRAHLSCNGNGLRLELHDDGDGFRVKDRHDGMGLAGMRERVEQMGGELEIASARGKGTKITVLLPGNGKSMS
jgi:two-component sensor histidine kinase